jgi:hypothetical protein
VAEPQAPVRGAQAAAQIDLDDADDLVDLVIGHSRLAEAVDEDDALDRIDARSGIAVASDFSMRRA